MSYLLNANRDEKKIEFFVGGINDFFTFFSAEKLIRPGRN